MKDLFFVKSCHNSEAGAANAATSATSSTKEVKGGVAELIQNILEGNALEVLDYVHEALKSASLPLKKEYFERAMYALRLSAICGSIALNIVNFID